MDSVLLRDSDIVPVPDGEYVMLSEIEGVGAIVLVTVMEVVAVSDDVGVWEAVPVGEDVEVPVFDAVCVFEFVLVPVGVKVPVTVLVMDVVALYVAEGEPVGDAVLEADRVDEVEKEGDFEAGCPDTNAICTVTAATSASISHARKGGRRRPATPVCVRDQVEPSSR